MQPQNYNYNHNKVTEIKKAVVRQIEAEKAQYAPATDQINKSKFVIPDVPDYSFGRFIQEKPFAPNWLFEGILRAETVGQIVAAGGTGKTYFLLQLGCALACGKPFGPFRPVRQERVLMLAGEDSEDILHERAHAIAQTIDPLNINDVAGNFILVSTVGILVKPFMALDELGNPTATETFYEWLCPLIERARPDVLLLDPMSRFNHLPENSNEAGTAWVQNLEMISREYGCTVLFTHHESKAGNRSDDLRMTSGRGASSRLDAVRWSLAMKGMSAEAGERFGVNPRDYVTYDVIKNNYGANLPHTYYLKRGDGGVLEPVNLHADRFEAMGETLISLIGDCEERPSRRDLVRGKDYGHISDELKNTFHGFRRRNDMEKIVGWCIEKGWLAEEETFKSGRPKKILAVKRYPKRGLAG